MKRALLGFLLATSSYATAQVTPYTAADGSYRVKFPYPYKVVGAQIVVLKGREGWDVMQTPYSGDQATLRRRLVEANSHPIKVGSIDGSETVNKRDGYCSITRLFVANHSVYKISAAFQNSPAKAAQGRAFVNSFQFTGRIAGELHSSENAEALKGCANQIKNIEMVCKMWASDHQGSYPGSLQELTPAYLRHPPICPVTGKNSYRYFRRGAGFEVRCDGH